MHALPHERAQLLAILVGIGAQLLLQLAHDGNWVLEGIFPALESARIWRFGRHNYMRNRHTVWLGGGVDMWRFTMAKRFTEA